MFCRFSVPTFISLIPRATGMGETREIHYLTKSPEALEILMNKYKSLEDLVEFEPIKRALLLGEGKLGIAIYPLGGDLGNVALKSGKKKISFNSQPWGIEIKEGDTKYRVYFKEYQAISSVLNI